MSTKAKLAAAKGVLNLTSAPTYRQVAAIFGIILFACAVIEGSPAAALDSRFSELAIFRQMMSVAQSAGWNAAGPRWSDFAVTSLVAWIDELLAAAPVPAVAHEVPGADTIDLTIDASAWGVGVIARTAQKVQLHALKWNADEHAVLQQSKYASSRTEPCAAVKAALVCIPPTVAPGTIVTIVTDHMGLVFAARRGYGRTWAYNEALRRLRTSFPGLTFRFRWLPGAENEVADALSRGRQLEESEQAQMPIIRVGPPSVRVG
jgi:hypothetical protein